MASDSKRNQVLKDLAPALMDNEKVLLWSTGIARVKRFGSNTERRGTLFVSDRRVGIFTKKMGGHDLLDFAYGLLTSIQYKKGIGFGEITLLASGDSTRFHQMPKAGVEEIAQAIRQRMALAHQGGAVAPPPSQPPVSVADEVLKLASLRDSGLLTDDQFEAQKARLLD
jgi:hypothetical protein